MGGGPDCPPGFPHHHPTTSYWQLPPHAIANHRTTAELPVASTFDYVIIGSGISGAAVAFRLLSREPSCSVLMLEARTAASGASGRNGGHCRAGWWMKIKRYYEAFGEDEAIKFYNLEHENVRKVAAFVRDHGVDCDFVDVETADAYLTEETWKEALGVRQFILDLQKRRPDMQPKLSLEVRSGDDARTYLGIPGIVGAVTYQAHTQNPYRLVCHMLQLCLERGLNLQTGTLVTDVKQSGPGVTWEIDTERGTVRGHKVVLATNAYTNALHPGLASTRFLVPARNQVAAVRPGKNIIKDPAQPLTGRTCNMYDLATGDYWMSRPPGSRGQGDLLYAGAKSLSETNERNTTDDSVVNPTIAAYLHRGAVRVFGEEKWGEVGPLVRDWTGIVAYTPDTFPLVGEAPDQKGLWMSVGMNGHGMALALQCAEALVQMMVDGNKPEWLPDAFRLGRVFEGETVYLRAWMRPEDRI